MDASEGRLLGCMPVRGLTVEGCVKSWSSFWTEGLNVAHTDDVRRDGWQRNGMLMV